MLTLSRRRRRTTVGLAVAAVVASTAGIAVLSRGAEAAATDQAFFDSSTRPTLITDRAGGAVNLGVTFSVAKPGAVTGVRLFRTAPRDVHQVFLWDASGAQIARATLPATGSGWMDVSFAKAVAAQPGRSYVASYLDDTGSYGFVRGQFAAALQVGDLRAPVSAGVYRYGNQPAFPAQTFRNTGYAITPLFRVGGSGATPPSTPKPTTAAPTPTVKPTTSKPTATATRTATSTPRPTTTFTIPSVAGFPDASNTGVAGCPTLQKVDNGDEVQLRTDGEVLENKEYLNPVVIRVLAHNVKIRCVKLNGSGFFGIDNTDLQNAANNANDTSVDRVDISCGDKGQVIGVLLKSGTLSRSNVHNCDHMINAGGDNLVVRDNFCHDLTDKEVVHADCIQSLGGNTNLLIEHNSLFSRDTSDILLGQEGGDARNVVVNNNRLMSIGTPPPAYLFYVSGTNTKVTNNRFTRRFSFGPCTLNTRNPVVWTGNVWDDTGAELPLSACGSPA